MSNLVESTHSTNEITELNFNLIHQTDLDKRIKVDSKNLPLFNQLLQFAPDVAVAKEVTTNKYMQVVANGALTKAKDGNGQLGIVLGEKGIDSHARLFDPDQLKKLLTTSVAMRAVTMAVGQVHLAEISLQLKEMNIKIADIKQFLDDERASKIEAIDHYFDEYFLSANNSFEFSPVRRSQVEKDSREVDAVLLHLTKEIKHAITDVENFVDDSMFGSDKTFEALSKMLDKNIMVISEWFKIAQVKAKAIQAIHLSGENDLFTQRKNSFINQLNKLNKDEIAKLRKIWIIRIDTLNAKLSTNSELAYKRNKLRSRLTVFLENINDLTSHINLTITGIGNIENPIEIILEVSNNEVTNAYLPQPNKDLITEFKQKFLENLGKKDEEFELVPISKEDETLEQPKKILESIDKMPMGRGRKMVMKTLLRFSK